MSVSFLKKLLRHERQTGSLAPKPASGGRARYLDAEAQAWLVAYMDQHPDATLAELSQAWPGWTTSGPNLPLAGAKGARPAAKKKPVRP